MAVKIFIAGEDGASVRIKVSVRATVEVSSTDRSLTITVGGGAEGLSARRGTSASGGRQRLDRARDDRGAGSVSPEMEAAAVRAFLAGADATRLGRTLAAVYLAMDAVRRGRDPL